MQVHAAMTNEVVCGTGARHVTPWNYPVRTLHDRNLMDRKCTELSCRGVI